MSLFQVFTFGCLLTALNWVGIACLLMYYHHSYLLPALFEDDLEQLYDKPTDAPPLTVDEPTTRKPRKPLEPNEVENLMAQVRGLT